MYGVLSDAAGGATPGRAPRSAARASRSTCRPCWSGCPRRPSSGSAPPTTPPGAPEPLAVLEAVLGGRCRAAGRGTGRRRRRGVRRVPARLARAAAATGIPRSSSCARCPRPSRCRACASATPSRRGPPSSASSASDRRAASPRSPPTVAAAALRRPELAAANAAALAAERDWLAARLAELGLPAYPSVTNFLLVPLRDRDAAEEATEHLLRSGIVPRTFGPEPTRCAATCASRSGPRRERAARRGPGTWMDGRTGA